MLSIQQEAPNNYSSELKYGEGGLIKWNEGRITKIF